MEEQEENDVLIGNIILAAGFLFILFGMGIATLETPVRELSEIESRNFRSCQSRPTPHWLPMNFLNSLRLTSLTN